MRRVMIIGQPGSGKSTLAQEMGRITGLRVVHIDHIHWSPGWIERPDAEKDRLCAEVHARDEWIFEGGRSNTWPERLARCDTLIWLDLPFATRLFRVIRRTLRYRGQTRPDLPENCPERFDPEFFRWIWATRHTNRFRAKALFASAPPDKRRHHIRSGREARRFLAFLRADQSASPVTRPS